MVRKRLFLSVLVLTLCLFTASAYAADAMSLLTGMAQKIASAKKFSVTIRMGYDVVQDSGQKVEFGEIRKIILKRPKYLRVEAKQSDGDVNGIVFDGRTFTQYSLTPNVYARLDLTGDIDKAVRFAVAKFGVRVPLARMLVTTFPDEIRKLTKEVFYVEKDVLGKSPTDHVAGRTDDVDYQVWIGKDKLPTRIVITYKNAPGQPQFWANFYDWNLSPKTTEETFIFTPPKGAEEIPFILPVSAPEPGTTDQGGAS